jgi:K(+)-stimulated pyrophosphate-energized sodium pump
VFLFSVSPSTPSAAPPVRWSTRCVASSATSPGSWRHRPSGVRQGRRIVTKDSLRELITPGLLAVLAPIAVGFGLGVAPLGRLSWPVRSAPAPLMAIFLPTRAAPGTTPRSSSRTAPRRQGLGAHEATIIGDTVGDPFKDTAGPAINPLIKVMNLVSLLIASAVVSMSVGDDQNDVLRSSSPWSPVAIIAVAIYISKQREVSIGDDSTPPPAAGTTGGSTALTGHDPHPQAYVPEASHPAADPAPTQRFQAPPQ